MSTEVFVRRRWSAAVHHACWFRRALPSWQWCVVIARSRRYGVHSTQSDRVVDGCCDQRRPADRERRDHPDAQHTTSEPRLLRRRMEPANHHSDRDRCAPETSTKTPRRITQPIASQQKWHNRNDTTVAQRRCLWCTQKWGTAIGVFDATCRIMPHVDVRWRASTRVDVRHDAVFWRTLTCGMCMDL